MKVLNVSFWIFTLLLAMPTLMNGQAEAENERYHFVKAGAGFNTYQETAAGYYSATQNKSYYRRNEVQSPVYSLQWATSPKYESFSFGVNASYQSSTASLVSNSVNYGDYAIHHMVLMGKVSFFYLEKENYKMGASFLLGGGVDVSAFDPSFSEFDFTESYFHYQVDALNLTIGNSYGVELIGGYGALGYVRANLFVRFD